MAVKITKSFVDKVGPTNRDAFYFDSEVKGFGLKQSVGGKKTYVVQYRINGRKRRFTIGTHGSPWTPDSAKVEAKRLLGLVANNTDPAELKAEIKNDITLGELCDLYLKEGCTTKSPNTIATDTGRINRHIKPLLGNRKIKSVTRSMVERFMIDVANGKTKVDVKTGKRGRAIVRGGPGTASKCVALLSAVFNFAIKRDLLEGNPATGIKKYKDKKRERFLTSNEFKTLGETLAEASQHNPYALAAIKILMLTGLRKNEVINMRWDDLQLEIGVILIPESKTGKKFVPLTQPVATILIGLPKIEGSEFIFPGVDNKPYQGLPKVWSKIRAQAKLEDVRLHDLRHSFASVGAMDGESLYILGKLLGHADQSTTQRYAHIGNNPLTKSAESIASKIDKLMSNAE